VGEQLILALPLKMLPLLMLPLLMQLLILLLLMLRDEQVARSKLTAGPDGSGSSVGRGRTTTLGA
jgi:hypothetical protein